VATAVLGDTDNKLAEFGASIAANLILKGLDRSAETEADEVGAGYAFQNGYNPLGLSSFLTALTQKTGGEAPAWLGPLSEHPRTGERVTAIDQLIKRQSWDVASKELGEERFQKALAGKI
jgi:beta-barrel assembly-enhancing protease